MKRVLIVSNNALSLHNNNGKTLEAIFGGWDSDAVAQLFFNNEVPESKRFSRFFRITDLSILRYCLHLGGGGDVVSLAGAERAQVAPSGAMISRKLLDIVRSHDDIKLFLRNLLFSNGRWLTKKLDKWVAGFKPESIFLLGGDGIFSFEVAVSLSKRFGVPLDIYITDDYIINARHSGVLANYNHKNLCHTYKETFAIARNVFVIGDAMARAFSDLYGRECVPIMNSVSVPACNPRQSYSFNVNKTIDVVYAGGLHLGRADSLVEFSSLLSKAASEIGIRARLCVYSTQVPPTELANLFKRNGVEFLGALGHDELFRRFVDADFLLHVESFERQYVQKTMLSVSTKIPEYLSSGSCVIAYGPASLASIRLIMDNSIGVALTDLDKEKIKLEKLVRLLSSEKERTLVGVSGFQFVQKKFNAADVRENFQKLINA